MQVTVGEQKDSKIRVNVEVDAAEYEDALVKGLPPFLAAMGLLVQPGQDNMEALRSLAGDESDEKLSNMMLDCAVSYLMPRAVEQSGLFPACNPAIIGSERKEDGGISFGIEINPKPELELSDYGSITIKASKEEVTEKEIDERINAMAMRGAVTQPDIITGKPKKVPAIIDDKWVAHNVPGCNTVAQLRESLRAAGEKFKAEQFEATKQKLALAELMKRAQGEIPEETIEAVTDSMIGELSNQLAQQGLTLQDFFVQRKVTLEQMRSDARKQAENNLRQGAVLDAWFKHEGLELQDGDIEAALSSIAPGVEEQARKSFESNGFMFTVTETAQRLRATASIMEHVVVEPAE